MQFVATPYFNTRGLAMVEGWLPTDRLVCSLLSQADLLPATIDADSPEAACEVVFALLNADDRPNGQVERSLSVGDVVCLVTEASITDDPRDTVTCWAVDPLGFHMLPRHKVFAWLLGEEVAR